MTVAFSLQFNVSDNLLKYYHSMAGDASFGFHAKEIKSRGNLIPSIIGAIPYNLMSA